MRRPRFIAEQARHAHGLLGRLIAFIMARETWGENQRAIAALDLRLSDHVLDIGCGHGRSLGALAAHARSAVGVDPSDLMAEIAVTRNRTLVKAGRVKVMIASAAELPLTDSVFDKALCVHVIYFWKDLQASFREIARVLKPGGRLALVFRTDADIAAVEAFPADVYAFRPRADVIAALRAAGFDIGEAAAKGLDSGGTPTLVVATKRSDAASALNAARDHDHAH
jgi:SAM-dependent methyltransferase